MIGLSKAKAVVECPEGKLVKVCSIGPIILKCVESKITAGRGTPNNNFPKPAKAEPINIDRHTAFISCRLFLINIRIKGSRINHVPK